MTTHKRVIVALSGGVDSSTAAALLLAQGYEVLGVMLRLWREPNESDESSANPSAAAAASDAQQVAQAIHIPFHLLDCEQPFREQVVDYFIHEYAAGRTPNPCLACNRHIKFGFLMQAVATLGADYLATGHYAQVTQIPTGYQLRRGCDAKKDQSYVLYQLTQTQLARVLLPLGAYTKAEVRALAIAHGLPVAEKAESQDLCFVHDNDYRRFLRTYAPDIIRPGAILDTHGREVGQHTGLPYYTIGQRQGLGIAAPEPLYVREIDVARNALIVGPAAELHRSTFTVASVNWISGQPPIAPLDATVQVRYTGREIAARIAPGNGNTANVELAIPLRDITPGQATVFYQDDVVLGGGIIVA